MNTHTKNIEFILTEYREQIKYTDAEGFICLILGDGVVQTLDKVY
jgi:hypothetical protein